MFNSLKSGWNRIRQIGRDINRTFNKHVTDPIKSVFSAPKVELPTIESPQEPEQRMLPDLPTIKPPRQRRSGRRGDVSSFASGGNRFQGITQTLRSLLGLSVPAMPGLTIPGRRTE